MSDLDLMGAWQLIDYVTLLEDGSRIEPLGSDPYGLGVYTAGGHMSAHLMRRERPAFGSARPALGEAPAETLLAAASGYIGYAGRYTVDHLAKQVIHHVETAFLPDWIGTDMIRDFRFDGGVLTLRPPAVSGAASILRWRRAS